MLHRGNYRLQNCNYSRNGAYFITICCRDRKEILSRISVGTPLPGCPEEPCLKLLHPGEIANQCVRKMDAFYEYLSVDKYVIMPNHIHMLVTIHKAYSETESAAIRTSVIARFVGTFKRLCNQELGESIWQKRYFDHVIRNQQDYNEIWEYIENNPRKWMIERFLQEKR